MWSSGSGPRVHAVLCFPVKVADTNLHQNSESGHERPVVKQQGLVCIVPKCTHDHRDGDSELGMLL